FGGIATADDGREADGQRGDLAGFLEQLGPRVLARGLVTDFSCGLELTVGDETAGVHDALGDALPVEVTDFLQELVVLQGGRAARAYGALRLVVGHGVALTGGERLVVLAVVHDSLLIVVHGGSW